MLPWSPQLVGNAMALMAGTSPQLAAMRNRPYRSGGPRVWRDAPQRTDDNETLARAAYPHYPHDNDGDDDDDLG